MAKTTREMLVEARDRLASRWLTLEEVAAMYDAGVNSHRDIMDLFDAAIALNNRIDRDGNFTGQPNEGSH